MMQDKDTRHRNTETPHAQTIRSYDLHPKSRAREPSLTFCAMFIFGDRFNSWPVSKHIFFAIKFLY